MFVSLTSLNAIYLEVSLQFTKSFQVLEVHRFASVGGFSLHCRLHHAGSRRIQLWQRQRFHLKHMPGLRSSVSNHHFLPNPPFAKVQ